MSQDYLKTITLSRDTARPATLVALALDLTDMVYFLIEESEANPSSDCDTLIEERTEQYRSIIHWLEEDHGEPFVSEATTRWAYTVGRKETSVSKAIDRDDCTPAELDVLMSALDDYAERASKSTDFCSKNDLDDLGQMWQVRQEIAVALRKTLNA